MHIGRRAGRTTSYTFLNFNVASIYCLKSIISHAFNVLEEIPTCWNWRKKHRRTSRWRHYGVIVPLNGVIHLLVSLCAMVLPCPHLHLSNELGDFKWFYFRNFNEFIIRISLRRYKICIRNKKNINTVQVKKRNSWDTSLHIHPRIFFKWKKQW